jgi:hypothetical protein
MIFNITYGTSVSGAPEAFKTTVATVAQFFQDTFTDPVTVNVTVEFLPLSAGGLGRSTYDLTSYSYSEITAALAQDSTSGIDGVAVASLPAADPISVTHAYYMTTAQAKALGLAGASSASDGTVTFASNQPFDFDRSDGIAAGQYDFYGTVAHELSEVMGRELNAIGNNAQFGPPNGYFPLDLFKYTAAGEGTVERTDEGTVERTFEGTIAGYFSLDGGVTKGYEFNIDPDGDFGDWAQSVEADSFLAFSFPGVINAVSATDIQVMDVLGWNASGVSDTAPTDTGSDVGGGDGRFVFARDEAPHQDRAGPVPFSLDPRHLVSDAANPGQREIDGRSDLASAGIRGYDGIDWFLV